MQHPNGTGGQFVELAAGFNQRRTTRTVTGSITWADIMLSETYAALAATDPRELKAELVQIAAAALAWVEDLDQHQTAGSTKSMRGLSTAQLQAEAA